MIMTGALPAACLPCFLSGPILSEQRAVFCPSRVPGSAWPPLRVFHHACCVRFAAHRHDLPSPDKGFVGTLTNATSPHPR
jgi:hypothetical protein